MNITDFITEEFIIASVQSEDKEALFVELVDTLARAMPGLDHQTALSAITEREEKMSTGIGKGIAIPHGKTDAVSALCGVLGISKKGIDYDALDGEPVHIIFMLVSPESNSGPHIKALRRIASLLKDPGCYQRLCAAEDAAGAYQLLRNDEERLGEGD
jgi:mannitol/fructose-specific phosphotransferase system IIA component (Ntr-type)